MRLTKALNDKRFRVSILISIVVLYLLISLSFAFTRMPWCDEAWFASPAYNLISKGHMGTSSSLVTGWLRIDQHTYWQPPLNFLAQAGWYKVFGFSLYSMRSLSVMWGLLVVISIYFLVKTLSKSNVAALVAAALVAVDYNCIVSATDGRMDVMSAALGFAALASYMVLRERNINAAMLVGHSCVVCSGLTHPNGILAFAGLIFLNFYFDRDRIRIKQALFALTPYIIGGVGWGVYILRDPEAFKAQFWGNMSGRVYGWTSPWTGFYLEIKQRYLDAFNWKAGTNLKGKLKTLVLISYLFGFFGVALNPKLRQYKHNRALLYLAVIYFVIMAIVIGNKSQSYLIHILPLFYAILAIWIAWVFSDKQRTMKTVVLVGVCCIMVFQMMLSARCIKPRDYFYSYLPATDYLKKNFDNEAIIMGSGELAFRLGFARDTLIDDPRLGYKSGKAPDVVVVESRYESWFSRWKTEDKPAAEYITKLFKKDLKLAYTNYFYKIYTRK